MSFFQESQLTLQDDLFIKRATPPKKQGSTAFQDEFELVYSRAKREYLTDAELAAIPRGEVFVFDSEAFINYWVVGFKHSNSGKYLVFDLHSGGILANRDKLTWVMNRFLVIGFNSRTYDLPMLSLALDGYDAKELKKASNAIIFQEYQPYQVEQHYKIELVKCNHIDLFEVAPLQGSLKLYAGRLHCKRMQDMPIEHTETLTQDQKLEIRDYMLNDLDNTELLAKFLYPQLELRYNLSATYNVDLRSKSDAQVAEAVIGHEIQRIVSRKPERPKNFNKYFFYQVPPFLTYTEPGLQHVLNTIREAVFEVDDSGAVTMPEPIKDLSIKLSNCVYRLGIGGLHSSEKTVAHKANDEWDIVDCDVVSYYPAIVLTQRLYPRHLGKVFLEVYKSLVDRRVDAKKAGNKVVADSLKISVNGIFGKFGNRYSIVYSPDIMIQITISGQLCLLKLIELIEGRSPGNMYVLSANTDGVLVYCRKSHRAQLDEVIAWWKQLTGFDTESGEYKGFYSRDVNNYIGIEKKGKVKTKGAYSEVGSSGGTELSKNPETLVCNDAVKDFLNSAKPVEDTVRNCKDVRRFVVVRNVKGGAIKSGKYIGKTIRWYYSTAMKGEINYITSGNKVPNTDGARPLMEFPDDVAELPTDLDYERYIRMAQDILVEVAAVPPSTRLQGSLFEN